MGPVPDKIRPSEQGELSTTTNGILPLSLTNAQSGEPLVSSSQYDEEISRTDGLFGFSTAPGPWADCFANLLPDSDWMPSTNSFSNTAYSYGNSGYPAEKVPEQPFYPVTRNDLHRRDHPNATENQQQVCGGFFACDEPFPFPLWQSNVPLIPSSTYATQLIVSKAPEAYPPPLYTPQDSAWSRLSQSNLNGQNNFEPRLSITTNNDVSEPGNSGSDNNPLFYTFSSTEDSDIKKRRRPFQNPRDRAQTAQTRRDNACVRCRMQRVRCIPDPSDLRGVCLTCQKSSNQKVTKLPCLRFKIPDTRLFRVGYVPGHIWSDRWKSMEIKDISTWSDAEIRTIEITQDYSPQPLVIQVRKFIPLEGDMLSRSWVHGSIQKSVMLPPYAIANLKETLKTYKEYITKEGTEFFCSTLDRNDRLIWETYSTAINFSNDSKSEQERSLLKLVLRLWVAVRMTTRSERICGEDTLGMPADMMDQSSSMHGKIPITPVMGAQIDVIVIQGIMVPLRTQILEQLQKLILANKPHNWFCIYLCIFILLHNCSLITKQDVSYARKHGLKTRFAMVEIIADLHMGANILLAYFHYCCKGFRPFDLDWNSTETASMADLDPEQILFVQRTAEYVHKNKTRFREIVEQDLCEDEHYFVGQLYEEDWQPRSTM